jgi:hypothetical protein
LQVKADADGSAGHKRNPAFQLPAHLFPPSGQMSLVLLRQNVAGADMAGSKELLGEFVLKTLRSRYAVPVVDIPSA